MLLSRMRMEEKDSDLFMLKPLNTVPSELVDLIVDHIRERRRRRMRRVFFTLMAAAAATALFAGVQ